MHEALVGDQAAYVPVGSGRYGCPEPRRGRMGGEGVQRLADPVEMTAQLEGQVHARSLAVESPPSPPSSLPVRDPSVLVPGRSVRQSVGSEVSCLDELPSLETLVDAADAGLHPWVHDHVAEPVRRSALADELGFCLHTAAQDLAYAAAFAEVAPPIGQPVAAYLDRWVPIGDGAHVLVGPRYLGRDPNLPFVMVSASDRPLTPADRTDLQAVAREHLSAFDPGFVMLTTADPIGAWPDTRPRAAPGRRSPGRATSPGRPLRAVGHSSSRHRLLRPLPGAVRP